MSQNNSLINLYKSLYPIPKLKNKSDEDFIQNFFSIAKERGIEAFDSNVLQLYKDDPNFVDRRLIRLILNLTNIQPDLAYLSLYADEMNASNKTVKGESILIVDELLHYTMISFFVTIYSLSLDNTPANFERCFDNLVVLLDLQGRKKVVGTYDKESVVELSLLPTKTMHLAMDTYWTAWSFVIGHELYHLQNALNVTSMDDEFHADAYGYNILIQMIIEQKKGNVDKDLEVFYDYLYLSPMMLMDYFDLLNFFQNLLGDVQTSFSHPPPAARKQKLLDLYDTHIPDNFDTCTGNGLYNSFLDIIEMLKVQLTLKRERGKLDILLPRDEP